MNWLMLEKMFSCFYNKFRSVNCMHYIKCAVNSSLLTLFWLLQVCGPLNTCFVTTHSIHKEGDLQNLLRCDIPPNNAPQTGPHHIWCIYTPCHFFGHDKHTDSSSSRKTFFAPTLGLAATLGMWWSWLFSALSINFLTGRSLKFLSIFSPTWR